MVLFSRSVAFILQFNFLLATWTILSLWHDILVREWLHTMPYEVFLPTDLLHSSTVLQSLQVCVCIHPSFALLYLCTCKLNFSIWYPSLVEAAARSGDQGNHLMMYEPRKTLSTCAIVCVCVCMGVLLNLPTLQLCTSFSEPTNWTAASGRTWCFSEWSKGFSANMQLAGFATTNAKIDFEFNVWWRTKFYKILRFFRFFGDHNSALTAPDIHT